MPSTVLIVSFGPVPTPEHQTVEGGGMRCWGLALGLAAHGHKVTVAVNDAFPLTLSSHEGITLVNWSLNDEFKDLLHGFDAVIASYCMGDPSVFIAEALDEKVTLILDLYVPIYVEVSARDSDDPDTEYRNYMADIQRFNRVLMRGDYFLCANEPQKLFYTGVLASLGIVNPITYRAQRLLVVPFGIERAPAAARTNPYADLGIAADDFVLLWFGGLYPWFKIDALLASVASLPRESRVKLVIVGGRNPFNSNPDFTRQFDFAVAYSATHGLTDDRVYFVDWVDYADRADWYEHASVVISLNTPGEENLLAWRTRVIDYVWGELVVLTNGGDPLSEMLIARDAALRLHGEDEAALTRALVSTTRAWRDGGLSTTKANLVAMKQEFLWDVVVAPIVRLLEDDVQPYREDLHRRQSLDIAEPRLTVPATNIVAKLVDKARIAVRLGRSKGLREVALVARQSARNQLQQRTRPSVRRYVFLSHPIDNSGAPLVLLDIVEEFAQRYGAAAIQVVSPHILAAQQRRLRGRGIKTTRAAEAVGQRFLRAQLPLKRDDFVLMNTLAIYHNYRDYVFELLEHDRLAHAFWFIHEDVEQLTVVAQDVKTPRVLTRIKKLTQANKLTVLTPSQKITDEYADLFGTTNARTIPLRVTVDSSLCDPRPADDFATLNLFLSGNPSDGRKGQFLVLSALYAFEQEYRRPNPGRYRDFTLTLLAVGDDYVARQLKAVGTSLLGERFRSHPVVPRDEALAITRACNVSVCCSLNEAFALYIAEGMLMGHVLLRNDSAGCEEQLQDGVNGYFVTDDVRDFAAQIARLADQAVADDDLQKMGAVSQQIAAAFTDNSYCDRIIAVRSGVTSRTP